MARAEDTSWEQNELAAVQRICWAWSSVITSIVIVMITACAAHTHSIWLLHVGAVVLQGYPGEGLLVVGPTTTPAGEPGQREASSCILLWKSLYWCEYVTSTQPRFYLITMEEKNGGRPGYERRSMSYMCS